MKITVFTTSWWNNQEEFDARYEGVKLYDVDPRTKTGILQFHPDYKGMFGLRQWRERVTRWFPGSPCFISCGTWSDPNLSRFGRLVSIVNAGAEPDHDYTGSWNYSMCAFTAAMAYMLNQTGWDLLVHLCEDVLFGAMNWDSLLREFITRPEEVMSDDWYGRPGYVVAWKRSAASRFLHQRLRPNLAETDSTGLQLPEDEIGRMFAGKIWNPWPHLVSTRQDFGHESGKYVVPEDTLKWPFIRLPHPRIIDQYILEQTSLARPVKEA